MSDTWANAILAGIVVFVVLAAIAFGVTIGSDNRRSR